LPLYTFKRRLTIAGEKDAVKDANVEDITLLDAVLVRQVRIISYCWLWGEYTIREYVLIRNRHYINIDIFFSILNSQWEERMQRGLFRYDVTICETKVRIISNSFFNYQLFQQYPL